MSGENRSPVRRYSKAVFGIGRSVRRDLGFSRSTGIYEAFLRRIPIIDLKSGQAQGSKRGAGQKSF